MDVNSFCRFCQKNMRIAGVLSHCMPVFDKLKKAQSVSERLLHIRVVVKKRPGKSIRVCQQCVTILKRLEKDLPVYWKWLENEKVEEASAEATSADKRDSEPRALKFCHNPASPGRTTGNVNVRRNITESFDEQTDNPESPNLTTDSIMDKSGQIDGDDRSVDVGPDKSIDEQTDRPECSFTVIMDEFGNTDVGQLVATQYHSVAAKGTPINAPSAEMAGDLAGINSSTGLQMSTVKSERKSDSLQRIPTREKRFVCEICGKAFMQKCKLTGHMLVHTGKKPFTCKVCGKTFRQEKYLRRHGLIHTGEQPYICQECGKRFNHVQNLTRHQRTVHSGVKAFSCHICQKRFSQGQGLKGHLLVHTWLTLFQCSICNKSYRSLMSLKRHQAVHMDVKPSTCELCGEAFPHLSSLCRHKCHKHKDNTGQKTVKTVAKKS